MHMASSPIRALPCIVITVTIVVIAVGVMVVPAVAAPAPPGSPASRTPVPSELTRLFGRAGPVCRRGCRCCSLLLHQPKRQSPICCLGSLSLHGRVMLFFLRAQYTQRKLSIGGFRLQQLACHVSVSFFLRR